MELMQSTELSTTIHGVIATSAMRAWIESIECLDVGFPTLELRGLLLNMWYQVRFVAGRVQLPDLLRNTKFFTALEVNGDMSVSRCS
jgi:hypothetical protein